ncbi:MAG: ethanolamine utilization protein EutN [Acidobacteria bacterium]|nr:ethanolamine utilization protein EutN [Acidobacteriota bacterium]
MLLARVVGNVVATKKDPRLEGRKLLILQTVSPQGELKKSSYVVAVDTVGAGTRETVIAVQGSSARMAHGLKDIPVDTAVIGIVDKVDLDGGA